MKRWYITRKRTREANGDEREEMGLPRYSSKRSPEVHVEWIEYLNVITRGWHLEHLFATAFNSEERALKRLERLRGRIENEVTTLIMIGRHKDADRIDMIQDVKACKVPKKWPKDRRKHPERRYFKPNRWPYNKENSGGQLERR